MTQKVSHTQCLLQIKELLGKQPYSVKHLQKQLKIDGIEIGNRQLYRNIKEIGATLLNKNERLATARNGGMKWMIETDENALALSTYDVNSFIISQATNPSCLKGRQKSLDKIYAYLGGSISQTNYIDNPNWEMKSIYATHFYEVDYDADTHKEKIEDFLNCAADHLEIEIISYEGDSVSLYQGIKLPFTFYPIQIIYHRGVFFLVGIAKEFNKVLTLDIHQIDSFKPVLKSFKNQYGKYKERVGKEMAVRFGITQNMDDGVYDVELEFSSITGFYVKNHMWHDTFEYKSMPNGNWLMTMKCGINRELVGWIFQWMGNVKIVNPPELRELYKQQLERMFALNGGGDLAYSNMFQPK